MRAARRPRDHLRVLARAAATCGTAISRRRTAHCTSCATASTSARNISGRWASCCCRSRPCSRSNSPCRPGRSCWRRSFCGERMTPSRIGAVVLGLVGVLVILRPGHRDASSRRPAGADRGARLRHRRMIATKKLTTTESTFAIVFWMNVIQLAARPGRQPASVFVSKIGARATAGHRRARHGRAVRAFLPEQRIPRRRRQRRRAARFHAHSR